MTASRSGLHCTPSSHFWRVDFFFFRLKKQQHLEYKEPLETVTRERYRVRYALKRQSKKHQETIRSNDRSIYPLIIDFRSIGRTIIIIIYLHTLFRRQVLLRAAVWWVYWSVRPWDRPRLVRHLSNSQPETMKKKKNRRNRHCTNVIRISFDSISCLH